GAGRSPAVGGKNLRSHSPAETDGPPKHHALPRRRGSGTDRRRDRSLSSQRRHQNTSNQKNTETEIPGRRSKCASLTRRNLRRRKLSGKSGEKRKRSRGRCKFD